MMVKLLVYETRAQKGYSLSQLSKRSGVAKSHINNIENGFKSPTLSVLCDIARGLKVPCYELMDCCCGNPERKCKYNGGNMIETSIGKTKSPLEPSPTKVAV